MERPDAIIVTLARDPVPDLERERIFAWIAAPGCVATVHWGAEAAEWEEAVDWALVLTPEFDGANDGTAVTCVTRAAGTDLAEAAALRETIETVVAQDGRTPFFLLLDIGPTDHTDEIAAVLHPSA